MIVLRFDELPAPKGADVEVAVTHPILLRVDQCAIGSDGLLHVTGWVMCRSPIVSVEIHANAELLGEAERGVARPDVALAWPNFPDAAKSGFVFVGDGAGLVGSEASQLPPEIKIIAKDAGGTTRQAIRPAELPRELAPREPARINEFCCDEVNLTASGQLSLSGWVISSAGVEQVRIKCGDETLAIAEYGRSRPDVGNKFPTVVASRNCGFGFRGRVDAAKLSGKQALIVEALLCDGKIRPYKVAATATEDMQSRPSAGTETLINLDAPQLVDGVASRPVDGTLSIAGWALSKGGIAAIEVELDGRGVGSAYYGVRREDVAKTYPGYGWDNALLSGFAYSLPHRVLSEGRHHVGLKVRTKSGTETIARFAIDVVAIAEQPGPWSLRERIPGAERLFAQRLMESLQTRPTFCVWLSCNKNNISSLAASLKSIASQIYHAWQVIVAVDPEYIAAAQEIIHRQFRDLVPRIRLEAGERNSLDCLDHLRPQDLVLPLDAGDVLSADALLEFALARGGAEAADFIYADERRPNVATGRIEAFFKPDWSPSLLLSTNYIGRPRCATIGLMRTIGPNLGTGNFDVVLRCAERAGEIGHVRKILAQRGTKNFESKDRELRALESALDRRRQDGSVEPDHVPSTYRCRPKSTAEELVSIIIPTCAAHGLIKACLRSLRNVRSESSTSKNCRSSWQPVRCS